MEAFKLVRLNRIVDDLWTLVRIPSPTGCERKAAFAFAGMLEKAGCSVRVDETLRESPSVIGRLKGKRPGKVLQLAGHIDHIDVAHNPPCRDSKIICGRGAADMKNGLAGILETVRVLNEAGRDFAGEALVTAYGLHEAPLGKSECLLGLMKKGIAGDAAIVAETEHSAEGKVALAGKGQAIWNILLRRKGESCHELNQTKVAKSLFEAAMLLAGRLAAFGERLQTRQGYALLSPESLFVGQMHYGDFYNRAPSECTMQGTRRWHPGQKFKDVKKEMGRLLQSIPFPKGISAACNWQFVGEAFGVRKTDPVVQAQERAFKTITGRKPGYAGLSVVTDANRLAGLGKIPTVLCGFDNATAHSAMEYVRIDRLLAPCRIMLLTVMEYFGPKRKLNHPPSRRRFVEAGE